MPDLNDLPLTPLSVTPLTPADLGVDLTPPAPPRAPQLGGAPESPMAKILKMVAAGMALKMGPGPGTGLLQGMQMADQRRQLEQAQKDAQERTRWQQEQTDYEQADAVYRNTVGQRSQVIANTLESLRKVAETAPDKTEYDRQIGIYTAGLQRLGYRVSPNWLKASVPYTDPSVATRAVKQFEAYLKNPVNADLIKNDPGKLSQVMVDFDRDGDGVPERMRLSDLAQIAKMPFSVNEQGQLLVAEKGTTGEDKANADGYYQDLLQQALAEGKADTPALRNALRVQSLEAVKKASTPPEKSGLSDYQTEARIARHQAEFEGSPIVKEFNSVALRYATVNRVLKGDWSGPGDVFLVYEFMKALDPTSVVRESERDQAMSSGNIFSGWAAKFNGALSPNGGFLSPQVRNEFGRLVKLRLDQSSRQYQNLRSEKGRLIDLVTQRPGSGQDMLVDYAKWINDVDQQDAPPPVAGDSSRAKQKYQSLGGPR